MTAVIVLINVIPLTVLQRTREATGREGQATHDPEQVGVETDHLDHVKARQGIVSGRSMWKPL